MLRTKIVLILPLLVAATSGQANSGIGYYGSSNVRDQRPLHPQPLYGRRPLPLPGRPMPLPRPAVAPAVKSAVPATAPPTPPVTPEAPAEPIPAPVSAPVIAAAPAIPAAPSYAPNLHPNPGLRPPLYTPGYRPLLPSHPRPVRLPTPAPEPTQPVREPVAIPKPAPVSKPTPNAEPIKPSVVAEREPILQPAPEPETIPEQKPKSAPVPEPARQPAPEPALEPAPEPTTEPVPEPGLVSLPEPASLPAVDSEPEPVPVLVPEPAPVPVPEPTPESALVPTPKPAPEPETEPALEPAPEPLPASVPEPALVPAPEPAPVPALEPVPEIVPAPAAVSVTVPQPEPEQVSVKLPEREVVPISAAVQPISLTPVAPAGPGIPPTTKPGALPPLLPKRKPVREPVFGRQSIPSTTAMIYHPTPSYPPSSVATQAPPVVITTQSYPVVTRPSGTLKDDFQCKEVNGYYPIENECDIYIECKQGKAMKHLCPDGLNFNPAAKHFEYPCAYPSEVKCLAGAKNQSPKPTDKCPNQYGFYSINDGDCSKFIMCQEGLATIMNCPMGLVFNPQTSSCDWPANVPQCNPNVFKDFKCPEPPQNDDGQESNIIYKYRYGGQCKLYVACQHGHPRLLSCERGLSFDESSKSCINEDYVTDCAVPYSSPA